MLLLFDVDGTLVRGATDAHRDAIYVALREVHGVDGAAARGQLTAAGRTDGAIARAILEHAGVPAPRIDQRAADVREQCCQAYARLCPPNLSHTVLPGVRELLCELAGSDGVTLALLTGNYEPVARLKLARARIGSHFAAGQGAFGSDAEDREDLPVIARRRAGVTGVPHERERTIVIGDTPRDIACARADGVRCFAVATGPYGADELSDADAVVADAAALRVVLEAALSPSPRRAG